MSVNGANQVITAKFTAIQALEKAGDQKGADALRQQLLDFGFTKDQIDEGILNLAKGPEGTPEQRAARGAANQGAVDEVAQMKAQSQQAPVAGFGQNPTQVAAMHQGLKAESEQPKLTPEQQAANNEAFVTRGGHRATVEQMIAEAEKIDTKEEQKALGINKTFDKDVRKNLKSLRKQMALDTIYTDKAAYEAKVDELKAQGKWDKKNPSVTYMKPGALEAAKKLDESLKKQGISMFNADGSINKEVSQTVAQLIAGYGGDRADLNETKALAKELGVKEGDIKDFVRANNVDAQKNKKLVSILTGIGAGVGAFFAGPITNILGLGLATKEIVTNTINNNSTVDNNTTITNNNDIRVDEDGSTHIHNDSFTTGSSTTTNTSSTTSTTSGTGKKSRWNAKQIIGDLIGAGVVGLGVGKLMVSLLNHDSNILKDGKQIDALLKDEKSVKGKKNQEIVKRLIMADAPDEVKLNALIDAFGNAKGGKLNTRELVGALLQVNSYKAPTTPPTTTPPTTTPPTTTPPTTTPPTTTPPVEKPEIAYRTVKQDDTTYVAKKGDVASNMVRAFYPDIPPSKLYKALNAWGAAIGKTDLNSITIGVKYSFPPITIDGVTYEANPDADPKAASGRGRRIRYHRDTDHVSSGHYTEVDQNGSRDGYQYDRYGSRHSSQESAARANDADFARRKRENPDLVRKDEQ